MSHNVPTIFSALKNIAGRKSFGGGYFPSTPFNGCGPFTVHEPFSGAWQRNIEWRRDTVLAYHAVFACITLIASDISKLRMKMTRQDSDGIWQEIPFGKYAVLERPNSYQNRMQFFETWLNSKLTRGNTYVLLERNGSEQVIGMYVLNPDLVLPLVTPEGDVFYQLGIDNLTGIKESGVIVPASEIIHDRFNCLCHPLIGLSPIFACGLSAYNGLKIQTNSAQYFSNMSRPSGILTAPGAINKETADRLKESWESNYANNNYGRMAVLGDDLKYQPVSMSAEESQMVEQLRLTAEIVCSTFHVPKYKVIGDPPSYNNIEALDQSYYSQCLQSHIESIELCLDEGLAIPDKQSAEFDLDGLLRMDSATQIKALTDALKGGLDTPNEARKKRNQPPLEGGDTVWMQQQNWPMEVLAQRRNPPSDPSAASAASTSPADTTQDPNAGDNTNDQAAKWLVLFGDALKKEMGMVRYEA